MFEWEIINILYVENLDEIRVGWDESGREGGW